MMLACIKQQLRNIWSSKVKQHCGWVEKNSVANKKNVYLENCKIL